MLASRLVAAITSGTALAGEEGKMKMMADFIKKVNMADYLLTELKVAVGINPDLIKTGPVLSDSRRAAPGSVFSKKGEGSTMVRFLFPHVIPFTQAMPVAVFLLFSFNGNFQGLYA
jgi:hypothetical protein